MADDVRRLRVEIVGGKEAEQQLDRLIAKRDRLFSGGPSGGGGGGGGGLPTAIGDASTRATGPLGPVSAGPAAGARVTGMSQAFLDRAANQFIENFAAQFGASLTRQLQRQAIAPTGNRARDVFQATGVPPRMAGGSGRGRDLEYEGPEPFDESALSPETAAIVRATRAAARRSAIIRGFRGEGADPGAAFSPRGRALARLTAGIAAEDFARQPTEENLERLLNRRTLIERARTSASLDRQSAREQLRNTQAAEAIARARAAVEDDALNPRVRLSRIQEGITAARGQARSGFAEARAIADELTEARANVNTANRAPAATRPGGGVFGAGPFGDFNQAAFGPGIAALTLTFGLAPLFQGNQALLNANRQFGPFNQERGALNTERTLALTALGGQADAAQRNIDRLTNGLLRLAAAANLGGPLNVAARGGEAAAGILNVVSPIAGGVAALGAARAARAAAAAAAATTGGTLEAGAAGAVGGGIFSRFATAGRGLLSAATATGASVAGGGVAGVLGPLALAGAGVTGVLAATPRAEQAGEESGNAFIQGFTRVARDVVNNTPIIGAQLRGALAIVGPRQDAQGNPIFPGAAVAPGLPSDIATIIARQTAEARRANDTPNLVAAEQELLQRTEALAGLESQRAQLRLSRFQIDQSERFTREDQARDQFRLALGLGRQFEDIDRGQARRLEDIGISSARARRDLGIRREDQGEDIARSAADARFDLGVRSADSRADVGRNLGRSLRELDIGAGQGREDIERGFGESVQDLILGQIGGLGGGLIRAAIGRQRALAALDRNVGRQRAALGRGAGDQTEDIGIAEGRGLRDIGTGEGRAVRDADLQAGRALRDIGRGEGDATEDAGRATERERADAILNFRRQAEDMAEAQRVQTERTQQNNAILRAVLDEQERQLNRQLTINTGIGNTLADLQAMLTSEIEARKTFQTELDQLIPRMGDVRRRLASLPG